MTCRQLTFPNQGIVSQPRHIFQHPYSWASLGVDVRGRSYTLRVCYRISQQIRSAADRLLPSTLQDTDGIEDERRGIVSVFSGPSPEIKRLDSIGAEAAIVRDLVAAWLGWARAFMPTK